MRGVVAKRLAFGLAVVVFWAVRAAQGVGRSVAAWTAEDISRWQQRLSFRLAVVALVLLVGTCVWDWDRLQTDGRLSDSLLKDVWAEREVRGAPERRPAWAKPGHYERLRCFVPAGASAAGLAPYLNPKSLVSARAWIEPSWPWMGKDWWIVDVVDQRMVKMSRMDEAVLLPHPRMKAVQCFPANAMKFVNPGVNAQGVQEFQVMDLSWSAVY